MIKLTFTYSRCEIQIKNGTHPIFVRTANAFEFPKIFVPPLRGGMEIVMRSDRKILVAFILNLLFSAIEFAGGLLTGSIAIASDALHDLGDAAGIGASYFLEKKSKKQPDEKYTYGYGRYSVLGGAVTSLILLFGSAAVIVGAVERLIDPVPVNYDGMIIFALFGVCINLGAALLTREGKSVNQRAVSLHMLEDVLGWAVVLIGAVVMRFTDVAMIDPLMSIFVAVFIIVSVFKNLKEILAIFLEKVPDGVDVYELLHHLSEIDGVLDVHHFHIWTLDGQNNYATFHVVANDPERIKEAVREELMEHGIGHVTIEVESEGEVCSEKECHVDHAVPTVHHHRHHH